ncbi:variable surface protein VspJ, partial [Brachyspira catarrhinii]
MKILHLILTMILISAYSLFGYTILEDFNDFLIDEDQLTIRLDRAGVLAGSENVRFMIGVEGETAGVLLDNLENGVKGGINTFRPRAIAGIGYKNESFGIGFGYQFMYSTATWQAHTPIITATALGEKLRINVPVTIGVGSGDINKDDLSVSTDIRLEYYFDSDIFSRLRVNLKYGMYKMKANENRYAEAPTLPTNMAGRMSLEMGEDGKYGFIKDATAHSIGIDLRGYFIATTDPILIEPQIRLLYQGSVKDFKGTSYSVTTPAGGTHSGAVEFGHYIIDATSPMGAFDMDTSTTTGWYDMETHRVKSEVEGASIDIGGQTYYITKPQFIGVSVPVGFTAESDLISIYLEPALSLSMVTGGVNQYASSAKPVRIPPVFYSIGYLFYGELSITPFAKF